MPDDPTIPPPATAPADVSGTSQTPPGRPRRGEDAGSAGNGRTAAAVHRLVAVIARATRLLRIPTWLFGAGATVPAIALVPLALSWQTGPMIVGLVLTAAGLVIVAWYWYRRVRMLRAARDVDLLTAEAAAVLSVADFGGEVYARLEAAAARGGLGMLRRMAVVWRVIRIPSLIEERIEEQPHIRWFLPPRIVTSWTLVLATLWVGIVGWVLVVVAFPLSATSVL